MSETVGLTDVMKIPQGGFTGEVIRVGGMEALR